MIIAAGIGVNGYCSFYVELRSEADCEYLLDKNVIRVRKRIKVINHMMSDV